MPETTQGKEHALAKLAERRVNPPEHVDNSSLPAGANMYYYCNACGHLAEVLPETHWGPPKKLCGECRALKDLDWLE